MLFEIYPTKNGIIQKDSGYIMQIRAQTEGEALKAARQHINNPRYYTKRQREEFYKEIEAIRIL